MEGDDSKATDKKKDEAAQYVCRMYSLRSQNFLVLNENGDTIQPSCTGNGEEQASEVKVYENTANPTIGENSAHFVLSSNDDQKYALKAEEQNGSVSLTHYTGSSATTGAFVRVSFGSDIEQGPFFALKVANSQKCIAANKDGSLSLKPFDRVFPHPDTMFVFVVSL